MPAERTVTGVGSAPPGDVADAGPPPGGGGGGGGGGGVQGTAVHGTGVHATGVHDVGAGGGDGGEPAGVGEPAGATGGVEAVDVVLGVCGYGTSAGASVRLRIPRAPDCGSGAVAAAGTSAVVEVMPDGPAAPAPRCGAAGYGIGVGLRKSSVAMSISFRPRWVHRGPQGAPADARTMRTPAGCRFRTRYAERFGGRASSTVCVDA